MKAKKDPILELINKEILEECPNSKIISSYWDKTINTKISNTLKCIVVTEEDQKQTIHLFYLSTKSTNFNIKEGLVFHTITTEFLKH